MSLTNEQIRDILDGAPDGATHNDEDGSYWIIGEHHSNECVLIHDDGVNFSYATPGYVSVESIDNLREILTLRQEVEQQQARIAEQTSTIKQLHHVNDQKVKRISKLMQELHESEREVSELAATVERLQEALTKIDKDLENRNFLEKSSLRDLTRVALESTPTTSLNAVKREVARESYLSALQDYGNNIECAKAINNAIEYANQRYPDKE